MFSDILNYIKKFLIYKEPEKTEKFILKQLKDEGESDTYIPLAQQEVKRKEKESTEKDEISSEISQNKDIIKELYTLPLNGDLILREFLVDFKGKGVDAFLICFDGMVSRDVIDLNILHPLMLAADISEEMSEEDLKTYVDKRLLTHNAVKAVTTFRQVLDEVNFGGCAVFVDGIRYAFVADVKGWEHRSIGAPRTEQTIIGPQAGFNELLRVNTGLIRQIVKDENLIAENISLGTRSKTACSMMYIKDIVNESLVKEVKKRLTSIDVSNLADIGQLEQFIEDSTFSLIPQVMYTERPDRVAYMLTEGKVAIVLHGNPFVLIVPTTVPELMRASEDSYLRFPYADMAKLIRYLGFLISLLLPGIYIAITNFHQEMIPTDLLIAIAGTREKIPFPVIVEIIIMELSFELIREAGIRIPSPIGSTLGIVGGLILGQAAVAAQIVSPILVIIVAITGIGSFSIPNYSLGYGIRLIRFGFIILGNIVGFLGICFGIFVLGIILAGKKSFGVPLFAPVAPKTTESILGQIFRKPIWKQEKRPDYLNTKKSEKQNKISRGWKKE